MKCPCCNGTGEIEDRPPVLLPPLQHRIWDIVRKSNGIAVADLVERVYAGTKDGGPQNPRNTISVSVHHANVRLAAANMRLVSSHGQYWLQRLGEP
jgi:hypothetical protein